MSSFSVTRTSWPRASRLESPGNIFSTRKSETTATYFVPSMSRSVIVRPVRRLTLLTER